MLLPDGDSSKEHSPEKCVLYFTIGMIDTLLFATSVWFRNPECGLTLNGRNVAAGNRGERASVRHRLHTAVTQDVRLVG